VSEEVEGYVVVITSEPPESPGPEHEVDPEPSPDGPEAEPNWPPPEDE
jgi:hypothetical protein